MRINVPLTVLFLGLSAGRTMAQPDFQNRRAQIMQNIPDGILLLHARPTLKHDIEHSFQQDPNFYYLTGLANTVCAILAIDGRKKETLLFVPTKLSGIAGLIKHAMVEPDRSTAAKLGVEQVIDWNGFSSFIDKRVSEDSSLVIYTDEAGFSRYWLAQESNPPELAPIANPYLLWRNALQTRWPNVSFRSAASILKSIRFVKEENEIKALRDVATASSKALLAAMQAIRPGRSQREVEAKVVGACIESGAEGPSFWPWIMSGANAVIPKPFASFADYRHINRIMQAGELVRVDIGCDREFYKGDVGRTAPVSGKFDPAQRETWELLIHAYRAGLAALRHGITKKEIFAASRAEVERHQEAVKTPLAKKAVAEVLEQGDRPWHIHGVGLESAEPLPDTLLAGMVIAYEPTFAVDEQAFYLEDMILITKHGHEILSAGLPYTADELEKAMRK
jgi:Xaa-Pro aminopeptidase